VQKSGQAAVLFKSVGIATHLQAEVNLRINSGQPNTHVPVLSQTLGMVHAAPSPHLQAPPLHAPPKQVWVSSAEQVPSVVLHFWQMSHLPAALAQGATHEPPLQKPPSHF